MSVGLWEMSLMGGAMILCAFLVRALARGRLPAAASAFLWGAAFTRLLLPFSIPSSISFLGWLKGPRPVIEAMAAGAAARQAQMPVLPIVWAAGAAVCAGLFLLQYLRWKRILDAALPAPMTGELLKALSRQNLSRPVGIYISDRVSTPLTYGFFHPRIVLPRGMDISGEAAGYVIAHECCHIRRRDAGKKLLLLFAVCLHWFNPLVWCMAAAIRRDMEIACDQKALEGFAACHRAAYARTLLALEEKKRFSGMVLECFSQSPLEARIRAVMARKSTSLPGAMAAVTVYILAAAVLAATPALPKISINTISASSDFLASPVFPAGDQTTYTWQVIGPGQAEASVTIVEGGAVSLYTAETGGVHIWWQAYPSGIALPTTQATGIVVANPIITYLP